MSSQDDSRCLFSHMGKYKDVSLKHDYGHWSWFRHGLGDLVLLLGLGVVAWLGQLLFGGSLLLVSVARWLLGLGVVAWHGQLLFWRLPAFGGFHLSAPRPWCSFPWRFLGLGGSFLVSPWWCRLGGG